MNLFRPAEIYLIADAIEAMVFKLSKARNGKESLVICSFEGKESIRINLSKREIYLTAMSGTPVLVYTFGWLSWGDWQMWWRIKEAIGKFESVMAKVKLQDYRAFFSNHIAEIIEQLAGLIEAAEQEEREILDTDRTHGGRDIHPQVASMLQYNSAESMFTQGNEKLDSMYHDGDLNNESGRS